MAGLSKQEVMVIVNRWIGVSGGYLGDFTYRSHEEFYPEYCDLTIDPTDYGATTRERFIAVLNSLSPRDQARVLRGVLARFPRDGEDAPKTRNAELEALLVAVAERIERDSAVTHPTPQATSEALRRSLADADTLIGTAEAGNAVDRVHTALHAHLIALCDAAGLVYPADPGITQLFRVLRDSHPQLAPHGPRAQDITSVNRAIASIVDSLQPLRNKASLAHPNPVVEEPEAFLVINATRTLVHYLDAKMRK